MKTSIVMLGVVAGIVFSTAADAASRRGPYDGHYRSDGTYVPYRPQGGSHIYVDPRSNGGVHVNGRQRGSSNPYRIPGFRSQFDSRED